MIERERARERESARERGREIRRERERAIARESARERERARERRRERDEGWAPLCRWGRPGPQHRLHHTPLSNHHQMARVIWEARCGWVFG